MGEVLLRVGQLAERTGVSPDTVRHYERLGLLGTPGRTAGGDRVFEPAAVERVQLIRSAVGAGFSLRQLATFLSERQAGQAPCRKVRAAAERILAGVDERIGELVTSRDVLRGMLRDWDQRLARTPAGRYRYPTPNVGSQSETRSPVAPARLDPGIVQGSRRSL